MNIETLEILRKDIVRQIQYDNVKIIRMEDKLKEIERKIFKLKNQ